MFGSRWNGPEWVGAWEPGHGVQLLGMRARGWAEGGGGSELMRSRERGDRFEAMWACWHLEHCEWLSVHRLHGHADVVVADGQTALVWLEGDRVDDLRGG